LIEEIYKNSQVSSYQPPIEIADFTGNVVKKDFADGVSILNRSWVELNDLSVIERKDRDQRTFNAFVDENTDDPAEAWKWRGTRSKARNKAIAMHSQLTSGFIIPMFMAQNSDDEEDRAFSDFMRDLAEWTVNNSDYKSSYLMTSMGMLVNPVTYMGAEYAEVYQKIRVKMEDGSYTKQEVLDEVLSGFKAPVYATEQILITNAYEQNIQRQRSVIKRRYIDFSEAQAKYSAHENWDYVQPGVKSIYSEDDGQFYDIKDDDHPYLVEEATYYNRREDAEVSFIGGIYMGSSNLEANPIKHRDNKNAPKYNVIPFGYQRVNEHFYFYKSLMNSMYWDDKLIDAQYEMVMNRSFLDLYPPVAVTGTDKVDSEIVFPSSIVAFKDKDFSAKPILPAGNLNGMFGAMNVTENSMDEASVSGVTAGQLPAGDTKATAVAIAERNAQTLLKGVGKTLAESIVQYGDLMKDCILNHLTVPQISEIASEKGMLKYRTFTLNKKQIGDKEVSKVLKFDQSLLGRSMSDEKKQEEEMKMLEDIDYPDNKKHVYRINPEVAYRYKYLTYVEPEIMFPKNEEFMQAMWMQLYAQMRADPLVSGDKLVRETLYSFVRGKADDMIVKQDAMGMNPAEQIMGKGANPVNVAGQTIKNAAVPSKPVRV
jgi:ribosomal protein S13